MKKSVIASSFFYFIGLISILLYLFMEFYPRILISPKGRIVILSVFTVFTYFGSRLLCKIFDDKKEKIMKCTFFAFFIAYISLLTNFTLFDPMFARTGTVKTVFGDPDLLKNYLDTSFNAVPFSTISLYIRSFFNRTIDFSLIITNTLGNFTALMPLALFLPLFIKKCKKLLPFAVAVSGVVVIIELLQFIFVTGACDIDDFILNVSGAIVAFAVLNLEKVQNFIKKITVFEF